VNALIQKKFDNALLYHQTGRLAEAERLYREILTSEPEHAESLHFLGVLAYQVGRYEVAIELIGRATRIRGFLPNPAKRHIPSPG
jgi:protein O-GlcNAc transferase